MEATDLEAIRGVLCARRDAIESELPALDAAIARCDALIEEESVREEQRGRICDLSAQRRGAA